MATKNERFTYNAEKIPLGGEPGDALVKVGSPNYYTAWRDFTYIFETYDVVLDDGEY
jgi:hypothetical protein